MKYGQHMGADMLYIVESPDKNETHAVSFSYLVYLFSATINTNKIASNVQHVCAQVFIFFLLLLNTLIYEINRYQVLKIKFKIPNYQIICHTNFEMSFYLYRLSFVHLFLQGQVYYCLTNSLPSFLEKPKSTG